MTVKLTVPVSAVVHDTDTEEVADKVTTQAVLEAAGLIVTETLGGGLAWATTLRVPVGQGRAPHPPGGDDAEAKVLRRAVRLIVDEGQTTWEAAAT